MTPIAVIDDVFVAYPASAGTVMALRGVTLSIERGERLLVQGPNGSGKSTLLRVLTGEQQPTAGRVTAAGTELSGLGAAERRRWRRQQVGFVDQHARRALLPEWRVLDNVALQLRMGGLPSGAARTAAGATLEQLGLGALADRRIASLSGGEAQQVAICAALVHRPALVLADEPTTELDDEAADEVYRLLGAASRDVEVTVVLVSHDPRAAATATRSIRFRDGRLAEEWSPGAPEAQVVDPTGWVRLPGAVHHRGLRSVRIDPASPGTALLTDTQYRPGPVSTPVLPDPLPADLVGTVPATASPPIVELRGLSAGYGQPLFTDLHLDVSPGEFVLVQGTSGSGKSTLLTVVAGLLQPTAGTVMVAGTELGPLSRGARAELRRVAIGLATQSTFLAESLTVDENLALAGELRGRASTAVLADVDRLLEQLALTRLRDREVRLLSGGERQRVAVARCLVSAAPLLILDEPTTQQDDVAGQLVATAIATMARRGHAVLVASHDPALTERATRTVALADYRP